MRRFVARAWHVVAVASLAAAAANCAHAPAAARCPPPTTAIGTETATETETETETETAKHGAKGAHEPFALPYSVIDVESGRELTNEELRDRFRAARVIYVGEQHNNPHDHAVELEVLTRAPDFALAMEMLPQSMQRTLDDYVAGHMGDADFLAAVDWEHTWGYDFGFYRPLLALCTKRRVHAYALNAPRALAHAVAFHGVENLTPEQKRQLPEMVPGPAEHRELVREAFAQHPHGKFDAAAFERFYAAQLVWDETMAARIAELARAERLVVVAGEQHARRFAVPARAARRGVRDQLIILIAFPDEVDDGRREHASDLLWVLKP
jgi:uncharacterized iron-regulated protein